MVYKSFRANCVLRILLITVNIGLFFYFCFGTTLYSTMFILGAASVVQVAALLNFVNKTNAYLARVFGAIRYDDFSDRIHTGFQDSSFRELAAELNGIIERFRETRLEKERQFHYLQAIIQQTGIGFISLSPDGDVDLINGSARKMLRISRFTHIRQLESISAEFAETLDRIKSGEKAFVKVDAGGDSAQLAVHANDVRLRGRKYRLLTLQNIQSELEEKEMDAWKNLIRVLSHEIMNSITPISSLASTAKALVNSHDELTAADIGDIRQAVRTIESRSRGLMQFVQNYRQFAAIPKPDFKIVPVAAVFKRIESLMRDRMKQESIRFETAISPDTLHIEADPDLIEQVLLNLMKNAAEAVKETLEPRILLIARVNERSNVIIEVTDNGVGIDEDVMQKIFIPFFTTRSGGSGIGLSLSRRIMRLHGGNIRVASTPNIRTVFSLIF